MIFIVKLFLLTLMTYTPEGKIIIIIIIITSCVLALGTYTPEGKIIIIIIKYILA